METWLPRTVRALRAAGQQGDTGTRLSGSSAHCHDAWVTLVAHKSAQSQAASPRSSENPQEKRGTERGGTSGSEAVTVAPRQRTAEVCPPATHVLEVAAMQRRQRRMAQKEQDTRVHDPEPERRRCRGAVVMLMWLCFQLADPRQVPQMRQAQDAGPVESAPTAASPGSQARAALPMRSHILSQQR